MRKFSWSLSLPGVLLTALLNWQPQRVEAAPLPIPEPPAWAKLKATGFVLEMASDPGFSKAASMESLTPETPLFWRWKKPSGEVDRHPGLVVVIPAGVDGVHTDLGPDVNGDSMWRVSVRPLDDNKDADGERFYRFRGKTVLLIGGAKAQVYRIFPAEADPLYYRTSGTFGGLRMGQVKRTGISNYLVKQWFYPRTESPAPPEEVYLGPFANIIDPRDPVRESVSSFRLLGKAVLAEDLKIERELVYSVSGGKSIGGALRLEDVSFYPASVFADFEWHGIKATYPSAPSDQPPELIKHIFGNFSVGYDVTRFFGAKPEGFALHVGPQASLVSIPVARDFEPRGFVGLRLQPQWIKRGITWYGSLQLVARADGSLNVLNAGYMNCLKYGFCLSAELYRRGLDLKSGSDKTIMTETGVAAGIGANL